MLRHLRRRAVAARPARGATSRARLALELLETRAVPATLAPAQVRHAYGFDQITFSANGQTIKGDGAGQTIAIVDAYHDPNIFGDLDAFDRQFNIEGGVNLYSKYGAASTFLTRATPQGTPPTDSGWALEIALDVEWAHAIAPAAKILLVEARSSSYANLLSAVDYARSQPGVVAVSMSWGGGEFSSETTSTYDGHFTTPANHLGGSNGLGGAKLPGGVTFVASSGDNGAPPSYPAVSSRVLSVGGTTLTLDSSSNITSETGWSGSGGGYSPYVSEPSYQSGFQSSGKRGNPDVSYNGDPNSGFYVYDTVTYAGHRGWFNVGGTSAGAPQWAALVAIANQGRALAGIGSLDGPGQTLPTLYSLAASSYGTYFRDITAGNNGYAATARWDPVTGLGSPIANKVVAGLVSGSGSGGAAAPQSGGSGAGGAGASAVAVFAPAAALDASVLARPQVVTPTAVEPTAAPPMRSYAPAAVVAQRPAVSMTASQNMITGVTTAADDLPADMDPCVPGDGSPDVSVPGPTVAPAAPQIATPDCDPDILDGLSFDVPVAGESIQPSSHPTEDVVEIDADRATQFGLAAVMAGVFLGCDLRPRATTERRRTGRWTIALRHAD